MNILQRCMGVFRTPRVPLSSAIDHYEAGDYDVLGGVAIALQGLDSRRLKRLDRWALRRVEFHPPICSLYNLTTILTDLVDQIEADAKILTLHRLHSEPMAYLNIAQWLGASPPLAEVYETLSHQIRYLVEGTDVLNADYIARKADPVLRTYILLTVSLGEALNVHSSH